MNRQYGIGNSKYVVIFDPRLQVTWHQACVVNCWPLTWAKCNFEALYLRNGANRCMVIIDHSVVRYLRYLDKYCEYLCFDTSIEEITIYRDILWCHDTAKYHDMTIPVSIPCNHFIVDNCTLHDSNENWTSHQNHSYKLVICLQFTHVLISVLSTWRIPSLLWHFVNFCDLTTVWLMGVQWVHVNRKGQSCGPKIFEALHLRSHAKQMNYNWPPMWKHYFSNKRNLS